MIWNEFVDRWNPIREMDHIHRQMNRLFDNANTDMRSTFPAVNVWANTESAIATMELPGVEAKAIKLHALDDILTIEGTRVPEAIEEETTFHRQECLYGTFKKDVRVPFKVVAEKITAKFTDGILTVTLPRAEEDKPKKITITTS